MLESKKNNHAETSPPKFRETFEMFPQDNSPCFASSLVGSSDGVPQWMRRRPCKRSTQPFSATSTASMAHISGGMNWKMPEERFRWIRHISGSPCFRTSKKRHVLETGRAVFTNWICGIRLYPTSHSGWVCRPFFWLQNLVETPFILLWLFFYGTLYCSCLKLWWFSFTQSWLSNLSWVGCEGLQEPRPSRPGLPPASLSGLRRWNMTWRCDMFSHVSFALITMYFIHTSHVHSLTHLWGDKFSNS